MFTLSSDITIGDFRFSGVHRVKIARSIHNAVETAEIVIPARARILRSGVAESDEVVSGSMFSEGDAVEIRLGYDGELNTEFKGFVKQKSSGMPLTILCEGYSWLLRRNKVNISMQNVSISDLLQLACANTDPLFGININCQVDCKLNNVQVNGTGLDVISYISKQTDHTVNCFFAGTGELWCALVNSSYAAGSDIFGAGSVKYRLGFNVLQNNTLKQRVTEQDPVQVVYSKKLGGGRRVTVRSNVQSDSGRVHSCIMNQVGSAASLQKLANEKAFMLNYNGFDGELETFLAPFVAPGFIADLTDDNYPEKNGTYLVDSVTTTYGITGARRKVGLGVKEGLIE